MGSDDDLCVLPPPVTMSLNSAEVLFLMVVFNLALLAAHLAPHPGARLGVVVLLNACLYEALQNSLWTSELGAYAACLFKRFRRLLPFIADGPESPGDSSPTAHELAISTSKKKKKAEALVLKPTKIPPIGEAGRQPSRKGGEWGPRR